jgi:hypothetical protein
VFPSAVIAGGALRDFELGKPVKDVDIFIPLSEDALHSAHYDIDEVFSDAKLHKSTTYGVRNIPEDVDRDIHAIYNITREYQYDLIFCTEQAAKIDTFDINICQIAFDGKHTHRSDEFLLGVLTETLKVMNVNRTDRNLARMKRLKEKYPEYKVEGFDGLL